MHELSIVEEIVRTTVDFAEENGIEAIKRVLVQVGTMTGVLPKYLRMYYPDVVEHTPLEGSELEVEEIEAECFCRNCGCTFSPTGEQIACPECGEDDSEILHGNELTVLEITSECDNGSTLSQ